MRHLKYVTFPQAKFLSTQESLKEENNLFVLTTTRRQVVIERLEAALQAQRVDLKSRPTRSSAAQEDLEADLDALEDSADKDSVQNFIPDNRVFANTLTALDQQGLSLLDNSGGGYCQVSQNNKEQNHFP